MRRKMPRFTGHEVTAFPDAVQVPLRKERRIRRSPRVAGLFRLVLEHDAGGCTRRLQRERVEACGEESKGGARAGLRPCSAYRSIQLRN